MGYRVSWISVAAKAGAKVLAELGLTDSAQPVPPGTAPMAGALLANGTYVIVFSEFFHPMIDPLLMKVLSLNCIVVGCMRADGGQLREITRLIETGTIRPVIDKVFPFDATNEALAYVESGRAKGKVVIQLK